MPCDLIIIGENIHTTRVYRRDGRRVKALEDGTDAIKFTDSGGNIRYLTIPESYKETQEYQRNEIKHIRIAVDKGISVKKDGQEEAREYILYAARRQVEAGAHYLDVNVDEIAPNPQVQTQAMEWIVPTIQQHVDLPLSIDSSATDNIKSGLEIYDYSKGEPILNSASLERPDMVELAKEKNCQIIATAFGETKMPDDDKERVENVKRLMEIVERFSISYNDVFVDLLVFPIGVDSRYGRFFLDAVKQVRDLYGAEIHITGGFSNVSFGMPNRRLLNEVFIHLSVEAGCDSGIIDPLQIKSESISNIDTQSTQYQLAYNALVGADEFCMEYITAFREGKM